MTDDRTALIRLTGSSDTIATILTTMLEHGASLTVDYVQHIDPDPVAEEATTNGSGKTTKAFRKGKRVTLAVDTDEVAADEEGMVVASERRGRGYLVDVKFGRQVVTVPGSWLRST